MLILFFYIHATYSGYFVILMGTGEGISIFSTTLGYIFPNGWAQVHVLHSSYRCMSHSCPYSTLGQDWGAQLPSFHHILEVGKKSLRVTGGTWPSAQSIHPSILQYLCGHCDIKYIREGHRYWISNFFIKMHSWLPATKLKNRRSEKHAC